MKKELNDNMLKSKEIMGTEKTCIICSMSKEGNNGIIILNNYICEECTDKIAVLNMEELMYNEIKEKIKKINIQKNFI